MTHRHEMASRERLVAAARRKTPDRIPRIIEFERQVEAELKVKFSTQDVRRHFIAMVEAIDQFGRY